MKKKMMKTKKKKKMVMMMMMTSRRTRRTCQGPVLHKPASGLGRQPKKGDNVRISTRTSNLRDS